MPLPGAARGGSATPGQGQGPKRLRRAGSRGAEGAARARGLAGRLAGDARSRGPARTGGRCAGAAARGAASASHRQAAGRASAVAFPPVSARRAVFTPLRFISPVNVLLLCAQRAAANAGPELGPQRPACGGAGSRRGPRRPPSSFLRRARSRASTVSGTRGSPVLRGRCRGLAAGPGCPRLAAGQEGRPAAFLLPSLPRRLEEEAAAGVMQERAGPWQRHRAPRPLEELPLPRREPRPLRRAYFVYTYKN